MNLTDSLNSMFQSRGNRAIDEANQLKLEQLMQLIQQRPAQEAAASALLGAQNPDGSPRMLAQPNAPLNIQRSTLQPPLLNAGDPSFAVSGGAPQAPRPMMDAPTRAGFERVAMGGALPQWEAMQAQSAARRAPLKLGPNERVTNLAGEDLASNIIPEKPNELLDPRVFAAKVALARATQAPEKTKGLGELFQDKFGSAVPPGMTPTIGPDGQMTSSVTPLIGGALDPAQIEKKRTDALALERPVAQAAMDQMFESLDGIKADATAIKNSPSLKNVTGPIEGNTDSWIAKLLSPTVRGTSGNLIAKINALKSKLSVNSLQNMKAVGLSTGTITESEWPRFESLVTSLDRIQDEKQFAVAMGEIETFIDNAKSRGTTSFQAKFGGGTSGGGNSFSWTPDGGLKPK